MTDREDPQLAEAPPAPEPPAPDAEEAEDASAPETATEDAAAERPRREHSAWGESYEFTCKRCGEDAMVPFSPKDPEDLLCSTCYKETAGRTYDLSNLPKAPRRKHNTRVAFRIVCSECGKDDELDYVPKGVPMSEILCTSCMREAAGGESRWAMVQQQKLDEQRKKDRYDFVCADCGCTDQIPFEPHDDRDYYCYTCYLERERAAELERRGSKHDLGDNLFIRKRKTTADDSEE